MIGARTLLVLSLFCAPLGCGKGGSGVSADSSRGPGAGAEDAGPQRLNAEGKLNKAWFDAAWREIYFTGMAMREPAEKKAAAFEERVGKPAKVEGGLRIWWVFDGKACWREEPDANGIKGTNKVLEDKCEK